jgi:hypothetical protein
MYTQNMAIRTRNVLADIAFPELKLSGLLHEDIELIDLREMQLILFGFAKSSRLSNEDKRLVLYVMHRRMRYMIVPNTAGILQREFLIANKSRYQAPEFGRLKYVSDESIKSLENFRKIPDDPIWAYYSVHCRNLSTMDIVQRMKDGTLVSALEQRAHQFDEKTNGGPMTQPQTCTRAAKNAAAYTHFAIDYESFLEALLAVCRLPVLGACTYEDPVDQLDNHEGKWYIRNLARKATT